YFSLANVHNNNVNVSEPQLRYHRAALSLALNSVSNKGRLVIPRAVDKTQGSVFAFDLREMDWDRNNNELWVKLQKAYPYGLRYDGVIDTKMAEIYTEVVRITGDDLPILRADWFVTTATRPPLY